MAEMVSHETELCKTISDAKRDTRCSGRQLRTYISGLKGFSLSTADQKHAQRFINGEIDLGEFVTPSSALAHSKA